MFWKNMIRATLLLAATTMSALPTQTELTLKDEQSNCGGKHAVGDRLTCYVTFAGATDIEEVEVVFNRQEQGGGNLILRESRKLNGSTYEVTGTINRGLAGTYILAVIAACKGKSGRDYVEGLNLATDITLEIKEAPKSKEHPILNADLLPSGIASIPSRAITTVLPDVTRTKCEELPDITTMGSIAPDSGFVTRTAGWLRRVFDLQRCGGWHSPNDKLSCYVEFGTPIEPKSFFVSFISAERNLAPPGTLKDQWGLCSNFGLDEFKKISPRLFLMTGTVPACQSGQYLLSSVVVYGVSTKANRSCGRREYKPSDFRNPPTLRIENSDQTSFPELLQVSATPP
jgi:hypothetical protein